MNNDYLRNNEQCWPMAGADGTITCSMYFYLTEEHNVFSWHYCCRPTGGGLVQSVLAPVIGITNINLQYSPGAKRIDVLARQVTII